uniref:Uncharacterized protein n=1 Tax=Eustigmatophyceae sp. Chic 10/23 P-6w TaxID=1446905 RepID=A0A3R5QN75_9STRA|nr:hypothetical protein [Eustigmatophyceae sp. Chic 10/23 P-6w]QAA11634.1 hypothetical protein [Eustigmatophyceae sp. Chic 10/23 P-6w]
MNNILEKENTLKHNQIVLGFDLERVKNEYSLLKQKNSMIRCVSYLYENPLDRHIEDLRGYENTYFHLAGIGTDCEKGKRLMIGYIEFEKRVRFRQLMDRFPYILWQRRFGTQSKMINIIKNNPSYNIQIQIDIGKRRKSSRQKTLNVKKETSLALENILNLEILPASDVKFNTYELISGLTILLNILLGSIVAQKGNQ